MARKRSSRKAVAATCPSCGCRADPSAEPVNFCTGCGADLRGDGEPSRSGGFVHRVIADRYRLVALVGEGGMGAVYRAEHIRMGKALALKILRGDFAREPGAVERFLTEARIVSRLSHPHTIAVFDIGEIDDAGSGFYLAMEYVPGKDLATVLRESGPLPERRVSDIGQQVLGSLAEAHDAGIVHRDMKPGNVMIVSTRSGEDFVKVLDFGIAKLRDADADLDAAGAAPLGAASTTGVGAIVGTPNYLAPEQARAGPIDARTDLYAVGCLLYELAAGHPPFVASSAMAVVAAHLRQEPPPLAAAAPGVSRRFAEVIHRALRKDPAERFASADEMRAALADASEPTGTHPLPRRAVDVDGVLPIASREDFAELDRHVRALRGARLLGPALLVLAALAGAVAWRWADAYALLAARAPRLAAQVPASLRPPPPPDGEEHEPNDTPAQANPLPLLPGADGRPGRGLARVRGHVGARRTDTEGDEDVFRIEVPAGDEPRALVAEWRGERPGEGIRGLDVALGLNRARDPGDPAPAARLVATADRGAPGQPERLVAAVSPGVYYLAVRERHAAETGPVEKPTDAYVLSVMLVDPPRGEELEPNDGPEREGPPLDRYPDWRAAAARNPLGEAAPLRGDTAPDDPDLFAIEPRRAGDAPALVLAVPEPGLALSARLWRPDAGDLAPPLQQDRIPPSPPRSGGEGRGEGAAPRFGDAIAAGAGAVLVVRLGQAPRAGEPDLLELRAAEGQGRYELVALGDGAASGAAVLALVRALADAGRSATALEVAGAFATELPRSAAREEVLRVAREIGLRAAPGLAPEGVASFERASQLLGAAAFEVVDGQVRPGAALDPAAATTAGSTTAP